MRLREFVHINTGEREMVRTASSTYNDDIWNAIGARRPEPWLCDLARELGRGADTALDVGCGDGLYLLALAEGSATQIGVDRSIVALARARELVPDAWLELVGDDERLPLPDNTADFGWCVDTLEHVVDTQTVLSEVRRVLAPGAMLVVVTPGHGLIRRLRLALGAWKRHFDPFSPHLRFYTAASLRNTLKSCGFEVESVRPKRGRLVATARRG